MIFVSFHMPFISSSCGCPSDDAFLLSEPHVTAMFQCLEAVEQNNPKLLAQVDTVGVGYSCFQMYFKLPLNGGKNTCIMVHWSRVGEDYL